MASNIKTLRLSEKEEGNEIDWSNYEFFGSYQNFRRGYCLEPMALNNGSKIVRLNLVDSAYSYFLAEDLEGTHIIYRIPKGQDERRQL